MKRTTSTSKGEATNSLPKRKRSRVRIDLDPKTGRVVPHPEFAAASELYRNAIWKVAIKCAVYINDRLKVHKRSNARRSAEDFIGEAFIHLNYCLHLHEKLRGSKLLTYYLKTAFIAVLKRSTERDSELRARRRLGRSGDQVVHTEVDSASGPAYVDSVTQAVCPNSVPEQEDWAQQILVHYPSVEAFWREIEDLVTKLAYRVLRAVYVKGKQLKDVDPAMTVPAASSHIKRGRRDIREGLLSSARVGKIAAEFLEKK